MKNFILLAICCLSISACGRHQTLPQNQVYLGRSETALVLTGTPASQWRGEILQAIDGLPHGRRYAVVTTGQNVSAANRRQLTNGLYAGGFQKDNIRWKTGPKREAAITFNTVALVQPLACRSFGEPHWYSSAGVSHGFGASTEWNEASQLADIYELAFPKPIGRPNPLAAVGAVERYQKGQVRPLLSQSIEAGEVEN
ncbi:MAG: hypothetical protein LBP33_13125 [Candidatus Adiutrix sp.]|jgi:hypothetical protein|nr:hypothetical protein [Candidatus Adiutrix sp.]